MDGFWARCRLALLLAAVAGFVAATAYACAAGEFGFAAFLTLVVWWFADLFLDALHDFVMTRLVNRYVAEQELAVEAGHER
jgi:hypothetical protein